MRFDLNLVAVLEAVMLERNVTRAAASLGMSQPAVSNALRRARSLTGDRLFIKVSDGVRPTARMLAIWPDLHRALGTIRALVTPSGFDPATDGTTFRIAVTDSLAVQAVHRITAKLRAASPSARVAFAVHTNANSLEGIDRGTLDCAVGMFPALPRSFHVRGLRTDRYLCVMRRRHALASDLTLDRFVAAEHVLVVPSGTDLGVVDGWLSLQGMTRTIVAVVNHFADALQIVAETDLLTCAPLGFVEGFGGALMERHDLTAQALPFETEKLLYKLVWHERLHQDRAHGWFRDLVSSICGDPPASGATR